MFIYNKNSYSLLSNHASKIIILPAFRVIRPYQSGKIWLAKIAFTSHEVEGKWKYDLNNSTYRVTMANNYSDDVYDIFEGNSNVKEVL